ncbi:MAG: hypothetical protein JKX68_05295 [Flavobacteriales bacterium]|nr:hypothetical protein [Flavobacteriales bacterium]
MKKIYTVLALSLSILVSCGENTNKKANNSDPEYSHNETIIEKQDTDKVYVINGDCDSFIKGIDFSSSCFTEKQHPEYKNDMSVKGRCQYQFSDDKICVVIVHKDYSTYDSEKIEMDKLLTQGAFQKTGKRLYAKTKQIDNLGDDAYIGYESIGSGNDTKLAIILSNVSVSINVENESCLSSDDELLKFGKLIIEQIKK